VSTDDDPQRELARLHYAAETAWLKLDRAHRSMPECEHVLAWKEVIEICRKEHLAAIKAHDAYQRKLRKVDDV
jgi:hypothetical protein